MTPELNNQSVPKKPRKQPSMLQQIRVRFTSGRPRVLPQGPVGPMLAVQLANVERDKIRDFLREKGAVNDFAVRVSVVTTMPNDAETIRAHSWPVPDTGIEAIIALADKLIKVDGIACVGLVIAVRDKKADTELQYTRPFASSHEDKERMAYAALEQRFRKAKRGEFEA